jgi:ABC-type transport system involved in multi-copper enzyme maturation permease subunit
MAFSLSFENPILTKELRTRMRGAKAFWILLLYLGLLSVILGGTYLSWLTSQERQGAYATQTYDMGRMFYGVIFAVQAALVGLITPALTAGALSIEREQRTFEALAVSPLSRRSIVLGKLTSSVGFVGLLLLSSLPLVALCFLLGGVSPQEVCAAYVLLMASAFLYGATGMAYSSFAKNTTTSTVLTYGTILLFFVGTLPLVSSINFSSASLSSYAKPFLLSVNPVGAMLAGNLTESYFSLAIPSWLVGLTINGLLGTILTLVALHRIEYPRTDRSPLLRGLTALFIGLISLAIYGSEQYQYNWLPALLMPILTVLLIPIFVSGEGLPKGSLKQAFRRIKDGNPVSGLFYGASIIGILTLVLLGRGEYDFQSQVLSNVHVLSNPEFSAWKTRATDWFIVGKELAITLSALFGFGSLTLLLSQKLKNRWGAMALSFVVLAVVNFLPFAAEVNTYNEKHTIFINALYLSPIASVAGNTGYGNSGMLSSDGDALVWGTSAMPWINIAFTSLLGLISLRLLKRARKISA